MKRSRFAFFLTVWLTAFSTLHAAMPRLVCGCPAEGLLKKATGTPCCCKPRATAKNICCNKESVDRTDDALTKTPTSGESSVRASHCQQSPAGSQDYISEGQIERFGPTLLLIPELHAIVPLPRDKDSTPVGMSSVLPQPPPLDLVIALRQFRC